MTDERPYTIRETLAAMILEHDAGGITLATLREARQHLAEDDRREEAYAVPTGWKLVPEVPTDAMRRQGESAASFGIGKPVDDEAIVRVWEWMLASSPNPPEVVQDAG